MADTRSSVLLRAQALGEEALDEVRELEKQRASIDQQIKELRAIARNFGVAAAASPRRTMGRRKPQNKAMSPDMLALAARSILENQLGPFVATELAAAMGRSRGSASTAISILRDMQALRPVEKVRGGGFSWAVMDPQALEAIAHGVTDGVQVGANNGTH